MEKANASVFTILSDKAKKRPVKIGFHDGTHAEILNGISAEAPIIVLGKQPLADGQPIRPAMTDAP